MIAIKKRYILAFDPSLSGTGFAVLDCRYKTPRLAEKGTIATSSSDPHSVRLALIAAKVKELRARYSSGLYDKVFLERGFTRFNKSTQATYKARGALESELVGIEIVEFTPSAVKSAVTGDGSSDKGKVAEGVSSLLGIPNDFDTEDESDALAVAYTGYLSHFLKEEWD